MIKNCLYCGKPFDKHTHAKYGSEKCKRAMGGPKAHHRVCKLCGAEFESTAPNRAYCSTACAKEAVLLRKPQKTGETTELSRLDRHVLEADKAGLSYGQYVAGYAARRG